MALELPWNLSLNAGHHYVVDVMEVSRRDVENVPAHRLIQPAWVKLLSKDLC